MPAQSYARSSSKSSHQRRTSVRPGGSEEDQCQTYTFHIPARFRRGLPCSASPAGNGIAVRFRLWGGGGLPHFGHQRKLTSQEDCLVSRQPLSTRVPRSPHNRVGTDRCRPRAVWRRHGARDGDPKRDITRLGTLAPLRCPIPRDGKLIVPKPAGGRKAINPKHLVQQFWEGGNSHDGVLISLGVPVYVRVWLGG